MGMAGKIVAGVLLVVLIGVGAFYAHDRLTRDTSISEVKDFDEYESAYFAGGCFWCVEKDFERVDGVVEAVSGYMGGETENPTYKDHGDHRESVRVVYDADVVDYETLVQFFFRHHDPTDEGGSFYDRGFQYTSAIYPVNEEEAEIAERIISEIDAEGVFDSKIVTAVETGKTFWRAEEYHQNYYMNNPVRYNGYRKASGRDDFIEGVWGDRLDEYGLRDEVDSDHRWVDYEKPSDEELRETLTDLEYRVTQKDKTEKPFSEGNLDKNYEDGIYVDLISGEPLFSSKDKFDSGTGWPSFVKPISDEFVVTKPDYILLVPRTEVRSRYGDNHIGHVFNDGPDPLGKRWCMNGAAMRFVPLDEMVEEGYEDFVKFVES
jgi:peptide methionine sulfoxide reductase msrA/msrB